MPDDPTPTKEPTSFIIGDTVKWKKSIPGHKASDSWVLTYEIKGPAIIATITAAANGDDFDITLTALITSAYTAGNYWYAAYVTKALERYQVADGRLEIKANLAAISTGTYDGRSNVKKVLDALEATLLAKASRDQLKMQTPGGVEIWRLEPDQLIMWRNWARSEYQAELRAEKIAKGEAAGGKVLVRFR